MKRWVSGATRNPMQPHVSGVASPRLAAACEWMQTPDAMQPSVQPLYNPNTITLVDTGPSCPEREALCVGFPADFLGTLTLRHFHFIFGVYYIRQPVSGSHRISLMWNVVECKKKEFHAHIEK